MSNEEKAPTCFVISPIGAAGSAERTNADQVLKHLIRKALGKQYSIIRGDEDPNPGAITPRIVSSIQEADLIVADLTGANANVFYELAIAHGYRVPTVQIQNEVEKIPFDVKDMRVIKYSLSDPDKLETAQGLLSKYASAARDAPDRVETPLTSAKRFTDVSESTDPVAESNVQTIEALHALSRDVRAVLDSVRSTAGSSSESDIENFDPNGVPDYAALRRVLDKVAKSDRLEIGDLNDTVTPTTSYVHDQYVRDVVLGLSDWGLDDGEINDVLYDKELKSKRSDSDFDPF